MIFLSDFHNETKKIDNQRRCFHYLAGANCNQFISAHSIQKKRQLNYIAENGHVYRLSADLFTLKKNGGMPFLKKIGINNASTFFGFCKYHDNQLFECIDNQPLFPNYQQIALYAYRSICRELFEKQNSVHVAEKMIYSPKLAQYKKLLLNSFLSGNRLGLEVLMHHKSIYDKALSNNDFSEFRFVCFRASKQCNLQVSGLIYPDFDFQGRQIQDLTNKIQPWDLITFFTAPLTNGWAYCFAWHISSSKTCKPFIQSLAIKFQRSGSLEDILLNFSLLSSENHAIRISWWDSLNKISQKEIIRKIGVRANIQEPINPNYLTSGC